MTRAREARIADLTAYLAFGQFAKRKPYKHLEAGLQRDIRSLFGDYQTAQLHARQELFKIANTKEIGDACIAAAEQGLGLDLCDLLSSFSPHVKSALNELSRIMGLPGKPHGIAGADVERYFREGRIREIADYCETDVVNTYRVWLRYELFRGRLNEGEFCTSEKTLVDFIKVRANTKLHLHDLIDPT